MRRAPVVLLGITATTGVGCSGEPSVLDPAGDTARQLADLWWLMLALGAAVWVLVVAVLARAVLRARRPGAEPGRWEGSTLVVTGGILLPVVVLVPLLAVVFRVADGLAPGPVEGDVEIEVVGEQFWWRVRYPDGGVVTANEIHVPVGRPVTLTLRSNDVIHSFWVPNVAGKTDLIPGETTHLRFRVDRPGVYRGACAEFCGIQHARMRLLLIAQQPDEFDAWRQRTGAGAAPPTGALAEAGREVFASAGCGTCHTVRGTPARGALGPDLTHLASRRTIGAGLAPNTRGNLAGWILDAQQLKPGNAMPPQALDPDELHALLAYLEGLE